MVDKAIDDKEDNYVMHFLLRVNCRDHKSTN